MFKLDLKNNTLTTFRTLVQKGLMQKVNIFSTGNDHLHAFYAPTKIVQIGWGHHDNFCVWKKSAITFGEGCRSMCRLLVYREMDLYEITS